MRKNEMVFIVMPAFNEGQVIEKILDEVRRLGFNHVIVVDDGSVDDTYSVCKKRKNVIVLRHGINRGKGAAVKTGMEAAKMLGAEIIVTMDSDGQHNPRQISDMLSPLRRGYDVVLGMRRFAHSSMPFNKIIANIIGNFFTWLLYGVWVHDSQCGLRAYSRSAFVAMDTFSERYEYDSEIIREIAKNNLRYKEMFVDTRYTAYSTKKKHRQSFMSGIYTLFRLLLSSL